MDIDALREFPRRQRRAFVLYVKGWSEQEVATLQRTTLEQVFLDVEKVREAFSRNVAKNETQRR